MEALKLPLTKEQIDEYMDLFPTSFFSIDYNGSSFNTNEDFLNYIANCDMKKVLLANYELDDKFTDLLLKYIRFDRDLNIPLLSELWGSILYNRTTSMTKPTLVEFKKKFIKNNGDTISEINNFFYSLNKVISSMICPTDEKLDKEIKAAKDAKLSRIGPNIVSISTSTIFYNYIASIVEDEMFMYDEFIKPVLNGNTLVSYFLTNDTPYKAFMIYNQIITDPNKAEEVQKQLDIINSVNKSKKKNKNTNKEMKKLMDIIKTETKE